MNKIKECIHTGEKTKIRILTKKEESTVLACDDCVIILKSSNLCKILEIIS